MKKLIFLAIALSLTSCKTLSASEKQALIDCGTKAVTDQLPVLIPEVTTALNGATPNWNSNLTTLIIGAGNAGICALEVVIQNMEKSGPTMTSSNVNAATMPASMALARAYAWKAAHPYTIK